MTQHRIGDADILINGERKTLRLTLGALASLEETLGQGDFSGLQRRLEAPRVADLLLILQALLQGGGFLIPLEALKASDVDLRDAARAIAKAFRSLSSPLIPEGAEGADPGPRETKALPPHKIPALRALPFGRDDRGRNGASS